MKDIDGQLIRRKQHEDDSVRYKPTLENFHHEPPNIIPQEGDYMVATLQHHNALVKGGYKINGSADVPPHDRMGVMYIGEHGLSQCSWGSPAQTKGRAIHCEWPGHWKLGLTPLDAQNQVEIQSSTKCYVKD